eukprot:gene30011-33902_t
MTAASLDQHFAQIRPEGAHTVIVRAVAVERPIALEFSGIGYAVMMASPTDLEDFATGFALSERLIAGVDAVLGIDVHSRPDGDVVRVALAPECAPGLLERVRHRVSESSCGMCGIENLEQALRPLPRVTSESRAEDAAVFRALNALRALQ